MDTMRKRVVTSPPKEEDEGRVLDEQEQEKLVQDLRQENNSSNKRLLGALKVILALSMTLQTMSFFRNPLLAMFPLTLPGDSADIPLSAAFTFFNIVLHINLALVVFKNEILSRYQVSETAIHPLPYQLAYAMASIPCTLSLFLRRPWQISAWWGVTFMMVLVVQTATSSIIQGNESVSELDSLRYRSPSA